MSLSARAALVTTVALAALVASAPAAQALKGEPEQLYPDALPFSHQHLWMWLQPANKDVKIDGIAKDATLTKSTFYELTTEMERRQAYFSFDHAWVTAKANTSELLPVVQSNVAPSGMTVSVWYRAEWPYKDHRGIWPVWALARDGAAEPWRMALILNNGVPILRFYGNAQQVFDAPRVPTAGETARVDDGGWHHLVMRVTREACNGQCATVRDEGYQVQPARIALYVDAQFRGEEVANIPLGCNTVQLGQLLVDQTYGQMNFLASPNRLRTDADLDEFQVWDAPLSELEINDLYLWQSTGYMAQYPAAPIDKLLVGAPGRQVQVIQVGAPTVAGSELQAVGGTAPSVGNSEDGLFSAGTTSFAWVRVDDTSDTPMYTFNAGRTDVQVAQTATGFTVTCGTTTARAAAPRPATGRFQLLAVTRKGTETIFYQDGIQVVKMTCEDRPGTMSEIPSWFPRPLSPELLKYFVKTEPGKAGFQLVGAPNRTLAWSGAFDSVLTAWELDRRVAPGARFWNATPDNGTTLIDNTGRNQLTLKAGTGAVPKGGTYTNDLRPAADGGTAVGIPFGVEGLADGTLGAGDGSAPFTVAFDVNVGAGDLVAFLRDKTAGRVTLAERAWYQYNWFFTTHHVNFEAAAVCAQGTGPFDLFVQCYLEITAGVGPGRPGRRFRVTRPFDPGASVHVAIAWGEPWLVPPAASDTGPTISRLEPVVAFDGKLINQLNQRHVNVIQDLGAVAALPASVASNRQGWMFGPGSEGALVAWTTPTARKFTIKILDERVYGHAQRDVEALYRPTRGNRCAESNRVAQTPSGDFMGPYCDACVAGSYALAGAERPQRECRDPDPYGEPCVASSECENNAACWSGRCLTTSQTVCDNECAELGRGCVNEGGSKRCGGCKGGLTRNANNRSAEDSWDFACSWQPTKQGGEACASNGECISNWCLPAQSGSSESKVLSGRTDLPLKKHDWCGAYDMDCNQTGSKFLPTLGAWAWSIPGRCAYDETSGPGECRKLETTMTEQMSTAPDGTRVKGVRCLDGPNGQCTVGFEKRRRLLSAEACRVGLVNSTHTIEGVCDINCVGDRSNRTFLQANPALAAMTTWNFEGAAGLQRLKAAFLNDNTPYTKADRARLIQKGVGPELMKFAAMPKPEQDPLQNARGYLPMTNCTADFGDGLRPEGGSPYYNDSNALVCEPQLQANGASCPPPGVVLDDTSTRRAWEFCESSFCDERGDKVCTEGGPDEKAAEGDADNANKEGKESVKFGIVHVDDTRIELVKDTAAGMGEKNPGYTANLTNAHVPCVLGSQFPPGFELFAANVIVDKSKPRCATSTFDLKVVGIRVNAPQPRPALGSCTVSKAAVGGNGELCSTELSCTPASLPNLKGIVDWAATTAQIPTMKFCIPEDQMGELPKKSKTIIAGGVPIVISIGLTLDACVFGSIGFMDATESGLPQVEIAPGLAIGVQAKAGVGAQEDAGGGAKLGVSAGVTIALTILDIRFPVRWGLRLEHVLDKVTRAEIPGLFKLQMFLSISIATELLSGWMGLFVELNLGPLGLEWTLKLFSWTGISQQAPIAVTDGLNLRTIDFRAPLAEELARQQLPSVPKCDGNVCTK